MNDPTTSSPRVADPAGETPVESTEEQRRTGRPRVATRQLTGDPVDEILAAAGRLFGELGVGGTTMSRIAKEVGLRQSSLYYYFSRKEEIVATLVARANVLSLALIERISSEGGSAPLQLFRFVRGDVIALCALPFDINEIHRVAARDPEGFSTYWVERTALERHLSRIIRRGVTDGDLRSVHVRRAALTVLSNDEGVQNWNRGGVSTPSRLVGTEMAELTVGGLLADATTLDAVREAADVADAAGSGTSNPSDT